MAVTPNEAALPKPMQVIGEGFIFDKEMNYCKLFDLSSSDAVNRRVFEAGKLNNVKCNKTELKYRDLVDRNFIIEGCFYIKWWVDINQVEDVSRETKGTVLC